MADSQVLSAREIVGTFYHALEQGAHPWASKISWRNGAANQGLDVVEKYRWLGQAPTPREFIGGRQPKQLAAAGYDIRNKRWESSIYVPVLDWRKDKTGQIQVRIRDLARRYGVHIARLISTLIVGGHNTLCYDGQYFFDTDHAEGASGSQSNSISVDISALPVSQHGSTTAPSPAEFAYSILLAIQQILSFADDTGEPMNEEARTFEVMVPTSLWVVALSAVGAQVLDGGADNMVRIGTLNGLTINVHQNARLNASWTASFAVFRSDGDVKPFIYQEDGADSAVNMKILGPDSEFALTNDTCMVATDAINNAGYGYWQHACKVTLT